MLNHKTVNTKVRNFEDLAYLECTIVSYKAIFSYKYPTCILYLLSDQLECSQPRLVLTTNPDIWPDPLVSSSSIITRTISSKTGYRIKRDSIDQVMWGLVKISNRKSRSKALGGQTEKRERTGCVRRSNCSHLILFFIYISRRCKNETAHLRRCYNWNI